MRRRQQQWNRKSTTTTTMMMMSSGIKKRGETFASGCWEPPIFFSFSIEEIRVRRAVTESQVNLDQSGALQWCSSALTDAIVEEDDRAVYRL